MSDGTVTVRGAAIAIRQFELRVLEGPDRGKRAVSNGDELTIGTSPGNGLVLGDGTVSRHHCSIKTVERGLELRDLDSTNGTRLGDCEVGRVVLTAEVRIKIGASVIAIALTDREIEEPLAEADRYGELVGGSPAMRRLYPLIQTCAEASSTVLVHGETGTGKELVAESIHQASARRRGPFVVVDCAALPRNLIESELFGHVRGAFTGAHADHRGAFETAHGGTLFLDEIAEIPLAVQPVLLRALESRTVRRIGASDTRPIDVRVIAATHRDLRVEVNRKRFRPDLLFRLDVLRIAVPPLRHRAGDIALLANHFWRTFRADSEPPEDLVAELVLQPWPGNVRELRNTIERIATIGLVPAAAPMTYGQAKDRALRDWERGWVEQLLAAHDGNLSRASKAARMGRSRLRALARRHQLPDDDA